MIKETKMSITLTPETEAKIIQRAKHKGENPEVLADTLLQTALKETPSDKEARLAILRTVLEGDDEEQRETGEYLTNALKDSSLSFRNLAV